MGRDNIPSVWILGDQLLDDHPALRDRAGGTADGGLTVVLVESDGRFARRPYHRKKQILLRSAMRHYAERLAGRGYRVDYRRAPTMFDGLRDHVAEHRPSRLIAMEASEYDGRRWQRERLAAALGIEVALLPNTQFLSGQYDPFPDAQPDKPVIMEQFYRRMRRRFDVLMEGDAPAGGAWNYDKQNRKPLPKGVNAPRRLRFKPDGITLQTIAEVEAGAGFGSAAGFDLAVTHEDAAAALDDFITQRLARFGDYEDAMTARDGQIYHAVLTPYLNLGLITPRQAIDAAIDAYRAGAAPINSVEGFVRQILGWREFMWWSYWRHMPRILESNAWNATRPLPHFFWTGETPMRCLAHAVERARQDGYTHHIERLMLLANFATLAGLDPLAVNDWFLCGFVDAYEWVMIPNVLGMGLNADGGRIATKPYVASASYIDRMSEYCAGCRFNPKARTGEDACPFNLLYWNFLMTHEARLRAHPRFGPAVLGLRHLDTDERRQVQTQAAAFLNALSTESQTEE